MNLNRSAIVSFIAATISTLISGTLILDKDISYAIVFGGFSLAFFIIGISFTLEYTK